MNWVRSEWGQGSEVAGVKGLVGSEQGRIQSKIRPYVRGDLGQG